MNPVSKVLAGVSSAVAGTLIVALLAALFLFGGAVFSALLVGFAIFILIAVVSMGIYEALTENKDQ